MKKAGCIFILIITIFFAGCGVLTMYSDSNPGGKVLYNGENGDNTGETGVLAASFMDMTKKIPDFPSEETVLYYQNDKGYLIPVRRNILKQDNLERACIVALINYPITQNEIRGYGLYPVLPTDLKILGLNIKNSIVHLDLNDVFLNPVSLTQERNMIASIVYTLTSFDAITGVSLTVNGNKLATMPFETNISGVLTRKNVMINMDRLNVTQGYAKFDSYMWIEDDHKNRWCIPVSKQVEAMTVEDQAFHIFDSMNTGDDEFETALPLNTRLEECKYTANTVILDFNANLLNYTGLDKETELISQIYLAAKQITGVENVILKSEGKKVKLKEGTNVASGLFLADYINRIDR